MRRTERICKIIRRLNLVCQGWGGRSCHLPLFDVSLPGKPELQNDMVSHGPLTAGSLIWNPMGTVPFAGARLLWAQGQPKARSWEAERQFRAEGGRHMLRAPPENDFTCGGGPGRWEISASRTAGACSSRTRLSESPRGEEGGSQTVPPCCAARLRVWKRRTNIPCGAGHPGIFVCVTWDVHTQGRVADESETNVSGNGRKRVVTGQRSSGGHASARPPSCSSFILLFLFPWPRSLCALTAFKTHGY